MNRRKAIGAIFASTSSLVFGVAEAGKKKRKKKGNKKGNSNNNNQAKKLTGKVLLIEENITKTYKLAGAKVYTFSRSVEDKIKDYEGSSITVYGRTIDNKIVAIEAVTGGKKS